MQAGGLDPDKASLLDLFGAGVVAAGTNSQISQYGSHRLVFGLFQLRWAKIRPCIGY